MGDSFLLALASFLGCRLLGALSLLRDLFEGLFGNFFALLGGRGCSLDGFGHGSGFGGFLLGLESF